MRGLTQNDIDHSYMMEVSAKAAKIRKDLEIKKVDQLIAESKTKDEYLIVKGGLGNTWDFTMCWKGSSAEVVFVPPGMYAPVICYGKDRANTVAKMYNARVVKIKGMKI